MKTNEYDKEPVFYCKHCLSLAIISMDGMDDISYCKNCNSTDIEQTTIDEWLKLRLERYKKIKKPFKI